MSSAAHYTGVILPLLSSGKARDATPLIQAFLDDLLKNRQQLDDIDLRAKAKTIEQQIPDSVRARLSEPQKSILKYLETLPIPSLNPKYKKLGQGSYGYVLSPAVPNRIDGAPVEFPGNVTKVFKSEDSYEEALKAARKYTELMGPNANAGQRVNTYQYPYRIKDLYPDLPKDVLKQYNSAVQSGRQFYTSHVHMMRLPHLGVDIDHIVKDDVLTKKLRSIPVLDILRQVRKLTAQTLRLVQSGYVHTDIRNTNVMVDLETGVMTIIDFDWLKPKDELYEQYPFTFYNNPPEVLAVCSKLVDASCNPPPPLTEEEDDRLTELRESTEELNKQLKAIKKTDEAEKQRLKGELRALQREMSPLVRKENKYEDYHMYYESYSNQFGTVGELYNIQDKDTFTDVVMPAICHSIEFMTDRGVTEAEPQFIEHIAPTFDNYGLGLTLLELFLYVYPGCITKEVIASVNLMTGIDVFRTTLKTRITNRGVPYSDEELGRAATAIREVAGLFHLMGSFYLSMRPPAATVVEQVNGILARYTGSNQAGSGRRTRRRLHKKKAKTSRRRRS